MIPYLQNHGSPNLLSCPLEFSAKVNKRYYQKLDGNLCPYQTNSKVNGKESYLFTPTFHASSSRRFLSLQSILIRSSQIAVGFLHEALEISILKKGYNHKTFYHRAH